MIGPDYDHFCRLAHARSGLVVTNDKTYLVQSRLEPVARETGHGSVPALLAALRAGAPDALIRKCIDAMATHESLFFRDSTPFDQLAGGVLTDLLRDRPSGQPLRIWSAACSSGQEPYSIAMLLQEQSHLLGGRRVEILATDMADGILAKARAGLYSDFEVQRGLSPQRRDRWMQRSGIQWEVSPGLKAMVTFRRHNLLEGVAGMGPFDIVFCRNVLIYFDQANKRRVLGHISAATAPQGVLFLGSAETVIGLTDDFALTPGSRGVYRLAGRQAPVARSA